MTILIGIAGQTGPKYYRLSYGKRPLAGEGALGCSFFGRSASAAGQGGGLSRRKFRNPGPLPTPTHARSLQRNQVLLALKMHLVLIAGIDARFDDSALCFPLVF